MLIDISFPKYYPLQSMYVATLSRPLHIMYRLQGLRTFKRGINVGLAFKFVFIIGGMPRGFPDITVAHVSGALRIGVTLLTGLCHTRRGQESLPPYLACSLLCTANIHSARI